MEQPTVDEYTIKGRHCNNSSLRIYFHISIYGQQHSTLCITTYFQLNAVAVE